MIRDNEIKGIPDLYETESKGIKNKVLLIRFYAEFTNWSWYVVEYDPENNIAFGYVEGFEKEWGYFSIEELMENNVKRDEKFEPMRFGELI